MVQEKRRVCGAREEITAGVAADGEVSAGMYAQEAGGEVALHGVCEGEEVRAVFNEAGDVGVFGPAGGCGARDVAAQAAGVVAESSEFWVGLEVG